MRRLSCASLLFACALPVAAADASGTWSVKGDISGYAVQLSCNFTQKGSDLSGVCRGGDRPGRNVTGQVNGKDVKFEYDVDYDGNKIHVVYTGTLESDTNMKGWVDAGQGSGTFEASKEK
jgi:hypothetical protein